MGSPLEGIRIMDLSQMLPGPFCTQILGDYGAEIIKVEDITGDRARRTYPYVGTQGARYYAVNRNKKSIRIDLRKPEGKEIFKKLASTSDVIVDGFRPGVLDRLGLSYEVLKQINDRIIYCSINAYGSTGPIKDVPAHDINILSLAGITGLTGSKEGKPALSTLQLAGNIGGSLFATIAILMALNCRLKTGKGQFCDISMMDGVISLLAYTLAEWSGTGSIPKMGNGLLTGGFAYFNVYETKDNKHLSIGMTEAKFWQEFCKRIGKPDYIDLQWVPDIQEELIAGIAGIIKEKTRDEWMDLFSDSQICITPVLSLDEMCEHPQVVDRDMIIRMQDFMKSGKEMLFAGLPIKFSETPGEIKLNFSEAGEHTAELLIAAGYSCDELIKLRNDKVI